MTNHVSTDGSNGTDGTNGESNETGESDSADGTGDPDGADERLDAVATQVESVADRLAGSTDADVIDGAHAELSDVRDVVEETAELVSRVDAAAAAGALERPDVDELGSIANLRTAVADREPSESVDTDAVSNVVDLAELRRRVDLRAAWRELRELEAEISELTDGSDAGSAEPDDANALGADGPSPAELELAAQAAVDDAVGTFREEILDAHERLAAIVEETDERTVDDPDGRNPSAFSTLPDARGDVGGATRGSTLPRETRYSTSPNRPRIYGSRFDDIAGGDDE